GQSQSGGVTDTRLDALEKNLFGATKSGTAKTRLAMIGKALSSSKGDLLLPPIAPKYDFGSGSGGSSSGKTASSSSASSS
ncbi:hypothetical protein ABTO87_18325, partial [Acinetobacter baumannii]